MKNIFKKILILTVVMSALSFVAYVVLQQMNFVQSDQSAVTKKRIAIFEPATHPAINEIAQGFIDEMNTSECHYVFTRYNANGNKMLLQAQAQEIVQSSYDLVFTIGLGCSVGMKEVTAKQGRSLPIVFCAIDDPIKFNVQGENITGVIDTTNYQEQLALALQVQPSIKKIILVYDVSQGSGLEKDKESIVAILQEKNIDCKPVEINGLTEIQQKVSGFMADTDLVMILKDNTIVSGIDTIIKLCQQYKVPLLATDLNSGQKGAALAYGIHEADSGKESAVLAQLIIEHGQQPSQIPVVAVKNMVMKINRQQAIKQGLHTDFDTITSSEIQID